MFREERPGKSPDNCRVNSAEEHDKDNRGHNRDAKFGYKLPHEITFQIRCVPFTIRSISLIPGKGAINPPNP